MKTNEFEKTGKSSWAPFEQALRNYFNGLDVSELIEIRNGEIHEVFPIEVFFRNEQELIDLEQFAIDNCFGPILDVGAGTGTHSLILQEMGMEVTSLEAVSGACDIMKKRGVRNVVCANFFDFESEHKFDTILFLMNGTGLAGSLDEFQTLLKHAKSLLSVHGQIFMDSTNTRVNALPEGESLNDNFKPCYFETIEFQWSYKEKTGAPFRWLYMDPTCLIDQARLAGFTAQVVFEEGDGHFLARLVK